MSSGKDSGTKGAAWDRNIGTENLEDKGFAARRALFEQGAKQQVPAAAKQAAAPATAEEEPESPFIPTPGKSPVTPGEPVIRESSGGSSKKWSAPGEPSSGDDLTLIAEGEGHLRKEFGKPVVPAAPADIVATPVAKEEPNLDEIIAEARRQKAALNESRAASTTPTPEPAAAVAKVEEPSVIEWTAEGSYSKFFGKKPLEQVVPDPASIKTPGDFAKAVEGALRHTVVPEGVPGIPRGSDYALVISTTYGADLVQRNAIRDSVKGIDFATLPDENKRELVAMCHASIAESFFARPQSAGRVHTDHPISQQDALAPGRDSGFRSEVVHVSALQAGAEFARSCAAIDGKTLRIEGKLTDEKVDAALVEVGEKPMAPVATRQEQRSSVVGAAMGSETQFSREQQQAQSKAEEAAKRAPKSREAAPETLLGKGNGVIGR